MCYKDSTFQTLKILDLRSLQFPVLFRTYSLYAISYIFSVLSINSRQLAMEVDYKRYIISHLTETRASVTGHLMFVIAWRLVKAVCGITQSQCSAMIRNRRLESNTNLEYWRGMKTTDRPKSLKNCKVIKIMKTFYRILKLTSALLANHIRRCRILARQDASEKNRKWLWSPAR